MPQVNSNQNVAKTSAPLNDRLDDPPNLSLNNSSQKSGNYIVEIQNLSKTYAKQQALVQINLEIEAGAIYGFIGPNGAGKTTTLGILATLLEPTSGEAFICGIPVSNPKNHWEIRRSMGYLPDGFGIYERMRVWEYLDFYATAYRIPQHRRKGLINDLLTLVDLTNKRDNYATSLSHGMKQRLGLARCLVHDPQLLLLDEPANGLDPRGRIELRELIKELSRMGKTIIISSHILTELSEMCTHAGIIECGQMLASGRIDDILHQLGGYGRRLIVKFRAVAAYTEFISQTLSRAPNVSKVQSLEQGITDINSNLLPFELHLTGDEQAQVELLRYVVVQKLPLYSIIETKENLEDIFMQITQGTVS